MFILKPDGITRAPPRKKVTVYDFPDRRIEVRHQGLAPPYRTLRSRKTPARTARREHMFSV